LHVPHNVGMNPQGIARAERALGLASVCVTLTQNYRGYETDRVLLDGTESWPVREAKRWGLLWQAVREFDVVHFNSGQSLFPLPDATTVSGEYHGMLRILRHAYARMLNMNDLRLLRRANKVIAVTYQGDDARQGSSWGHAGSPFEVAIGDEADYYTPAFDEARRRTIRRFDRFADLIYYANPDLAHVLPVRAEFVPYAHLDLAEWRPVPYRLELEERPLVVHAPFNKGVKGTKYVIDAVERLQREGIAFEFQLVEGVPHDEARKIYERAHLLIDQLLLGWYGAIAVEFMALGKPVVSHVRSTDLAVLPSEMRAQLPVVDATPDSIYAVLRELLTTRRHELPELGSRGRAYVERWHDPLEIAGRLAGDYESAAARHRA
jgi:hypothetical protein